MLKPRGYTGAALLLSFFTSGSHSLTLNSQQCRDISRIASCFLLLSCLWFQVFTQCTLQRVFTFSSSCFLTLGVHNLNNLTDSLRESLSCLPDAFQKHLRSRFKCVDLCFPSQSSPVSPSFLFYLFIHRPVKWPTLSPLLCPQLLLLAPPVSTCLLHKSIVCVVRCQSLVRERGGVVHSGNQKFWNVTCPRETLDLIMTHPHTKHREEGRWKTHVRQYRQ